MPNVGAAATFLEVKEFFRLPVVQEIYIVFPHRKQITLQLS